MGTLDNLDIESAVAAHSMWYKRFEQAILGIDADKLKELSPFWFVHISRLFECKSKFLGLVLP